MATNLNLKLICGNIRNNKSPLVIINGFLTFKYCCFCRFHTRHYTYYPLGLQMKYECMRVVCPEDSSVPDYHYACAINLAIFLPSNRLRSFIYFFLHIFQLYFHLYHIVKSPIRLINLSLFAGLKSRLQWL